MVQSPHAVVSEEWANIVFDQICGPLELEYGESPVVDQPLSDHPPPPRKALRLTLDDNEVSKVVPEQLHGLGYQVFRDFVKVPSTFGGIEGVLKQCPNETLINNELLESKSNDLMRRQTRFHLVKDRLRNASMFEGLVVENLNQLFPQHVCTDTVILSSQPGCLAQMAHTDYSVEECRNSPIVPLACIVALMDNTPLDVWPGSIGGDEKGLFAHSQIRLNRGDALVFRGDLVHGGAAFDVFNARLHVYLDKGQREPNRTHLVKGKHILPRWG